MAASWPALQTFSVGLNMFRESFRLVSHVRPWEKRIWAALPEETLELADS